MSVQILGIKIDQVNNQEALEKVKNLIDSGKKSYIVTPNPEMIVEAQKDKEFADILNSADLSVADGAGLVKLARLTGKHLPERIPGVDFVQGLAGMAEEFGYSMFLLGGTDESAMKAAANLKKLFPKLKIVGTFSGKAEESFELVRNKKIDILVVAFGHGKQEKWIKRNLPKLNVKLAIGVGGALDYISGSKRRAPILIQKANLEWLYRLAMEPWRIKRQLALPKFVYLMLKDNLSK